MTFKDVLFVIDPDQGSIKDGLERFYAKSYDSMKEVINQYKELKRRYGNVSVYRIEDEYESDGYGLNILLKHRMYPLARN